MYISVQEIYAMHGNLFLKHLKKYIIAKFFLKNLTGYVSQLTFLTG